MRVLVVLCVVAALVAGCSDEGATPIDLSSSSAGTATAPNAAPPEDQAPGPDEPPGDAPPAASGDDEPAESRDDRPRPPTPHAIGETPQTRALAEKQCHDDPQAEQGVIRIVDPVNEQVVGEVVVDCAEVRAAAG